MWAFALLLLLQELNVRGTPFHEAASAIAAHVDIKIVIPDAPAPACARRDPAPEVVKTAESPLHAEPMTLELELKDVPAIVVLQLACRQAGVEWTIDEEGRLVFRKKD